MRKETLSISWGPARLALTDCRKTARELVEGYFMDDLPELELTDHHVVAGWSIRETGDHCGNG